MYGKYLLTYSPWHMNPFGKGNSYLPLYFQSLPQYISNSKSRETFKKPYINKDLKRVRKTWSKYIYAYHCNTSFEKLKSIV